MINWSHAKSVARKEWHAYFNSPVAYVFLVIFLSMAAFFLFQFEQFFENGQAVLTPFFFWLQILYLFFVPALTMRLWADERRSNTIEILFTLPVRPADIILGKFLAAWAMLGLTLLLTAPVVVTTVVLGNPDPGPILTGYLGSLLTAGAFVAVGVWCSALTRNQVVGFILGVVILFLGLMMSGLPPVTRFLAGFLPGWLVDGVAAVSIFSHTHELNRGVLDFRDVVYFLSIMGFMLFAVHLLLTGRGARATGRAPGSVSAAVVLALVVAVNAVLSATPGLRIDLTQDKLFTLSKGTREVLQELPEDVTLKFYYSRSLDNIPTSLKQYAQRVEDLLQSYARTSGGKVVLEIYDPKPFSDEEEWANNYGLEGAMIDPRSPDALYLGLVAASGPRDKSIPFIAPSMEERLEYELTKLVAEVSRPDKPRIGILSALPMSGSEPNPMMMMQRSRPQPPWMLVQQLRQLYDVIPVQPGTDNIATHIDTLVVVHPKGLPDETVWAIDQFVLRGGKLLLAVDGLSLAEQETMPQQNQFAMLQSGSELNRLTAAWGYTLEAGKVFADPSAATEISAGPSGRVNRSPAWLSVQPGIMLDAEDIATSDLELLHFPFAGMWNGAPADGLNATVLVQGSPLSGSLDLMQALSGSENPAKEIVPAPETPLVVRLTGSFQTAFPQGKPTTPPAGSEEPAAPPQEPEMGLTESANPGVVVLVSDVDFLYDRFALRPMNILGQNMYQPVNDNLNLALNLIEQLSGNRALIGLRSRGSVSRPFDLVDRIEQQARDQWQVRQEELQAALSESQARLNELQQAKEGDQQFILSPEQQAEITQFREQQLETRRELRLVQKNLRRDVEQLGVLVKALNIALVPVLVVGYGVAHYQRRKRRSMQPAA